MDKLVERIQEEEAAKQKQCACIGCTNTATHTWSGYPTCDACGLPCRRSGQSVMPILITGEDNDD